MSARNNAALDAAVIERLERQVSKNPSWYRMRLAILAVAGDFALTVIQIAPWCIPILIGVLFLNHPVIYWLAGAAVLFLAWLVRPRLWIEGRQLSAQEAPELYRQLTELRRKLRVPGRMQVFLDDSFNASATESRGILGLFGTRSVLTLGVPLLLALDSKQVLAIVAHEFGHFSRRHGRIGHWLYRARVGWLDFAEHVSETNLVIDRAAVWYARQFVPFFTVRSFVYSRQCEYEADADATIIFGSASFAQALTRVAVLARLWDEVLPLHFRIWQREMPEPPADLYERFETFVREYPQSELQAWLQKALEQKASGIDTHPTLAQRLAALSEQATLSSINATAGHTLFGEQWPKLLKEFNTQWSSDMAPTWAFDHLRLKHIVGPLLDTKDPSGLSEIDQLARARALRSFDPAAGMAALKSLYERNPSKPLIKLAYGSALLTENDAAGVAVMETLAKESLTLLYPIYTRLLAYSSRAGNRDDIERWSALRKRAGLREAEAIAAFDSKAELGLARASSLPPNVKSVIADAIQLDPYIVSGWLLEDDCRIKIPNRGEAVTTIRGLVLTIDPQNLKSGQHTRDVEKRYTDALESLISAADIPAVRAYFTTEPIPKVYQPDSKYSLSRKAAQPPH